METAPGRGQHLLLIDDDEVVLLVIESLLLRAGYRVSVHSDGMREQAARIGVRGLVHKENLTETLVPQVQRLFGTVAPV